MLKCLLSGACLSLTIEAVGGSAFCGRDEKGNKMTGGEDGKPPRLIRSLAWGRTVLRKEDKRNESNHGQGNTFPNRVGSALRAISKARRQSSHFSGRDSSSTPISPARRECLRKQTNLASVAKYMHTRSGRRILEKCQHAEEIYGRELCTVFDLYFLASTTDTIDTQVRLMRRRRRRSKAKQRERERESENRTDRRAAYKEGGYVCVYMSGANSCLGIRI